MTLCLRMTIGERHYLLTSSTIETVLGLSAVALERSETGDVGGTAIMNDRVLSLIDVRKTIFGKPSRFYLNTRILIPATGAVETSRYGFIVEKALDLVRIEQQKSGSTLSDVLLFDGIPCHFLSLPQLVDRHLGVIGG